MSLSNAKVLYVFVDTADLAFEERFFDEVIGLEAIENTNHPPHHRHGVIKYDAGDVVLALNVADTGFDKERSDRVVTVFGATAMREAHVYARLQSCGLQAPHTTGGGFADRDGHQYAIRPGRRSDTWAFDEPAPCIQALHFSVDDLAASIRFYEEALGIYLIHRTASTATFATGNIRFVLDATTKTEPPPRRGYLTVFYSPDIDETHEALRDRGLVLTDVRLSEIGSTCRFKDPTGHRFCLYEPSEECLRWESGPTVTRIIQSPSPPAFSETIQ